jgi:hypothetical protein
MKFFKKFIIKKGNHHVSNPLIRLFYGKKIIRFGVLFNKSCEYHTIKKENMLDINKLFGLSFGFHHKNSVRFGWRINKNNKISILCYIYRDGKRILEWDEDIYMLDVDLEKLYFYDIMVIKGNYILTIRDDNSKILTTKTIKTGKLSKFGYFLNPYFGGDEVSPINMEIDFYE